MNENIHNEDKYFKSAYHHLSEEGPPPEVWNKINAALDKQDADRYRKKFVYWRLAACLLMLLLGSTAVYYAFFRTDNKAHNVTINKSKVYNNSIANGNLSINSKNDSAYKPADSITTNSYNYEKKTTVNSLPLSTNHKNDDNSYHPAKAPGYRKQDTEPVDNSSVKQEQYSRLQIQLHEQSTDTIKQFLSKRNALPGIDFMNRNLTDTITANSNASDVFTKDASKEWQKQTVTDSTKGAAVAILPNSTFARQNHVVKKGGSNKKNTASFKPYFTTTPFASADFTHYKLDNDAIDDNNGNEPEDKSDIQEREKHEFSYSAGIMVKLQTNRKLGVKAGAIYSNIAIGIQPQTLYASVNGNQGVAYKYVTSSGYAYVNPNSGITPMPGDSISAYIAQHHLQYLQIPVLVGYTLLSKPHFYIDVSAGIATNFLLSTTVETEVDDNNRESLVAIHKLQGLRPVYLSYVADANVQFYVNKHINFTFIPSFKYAINPINKNNVVKTYPYSFGIGAGVTYRL